jgi:hypothetical protein
MKNMFIIYCLLIVALFGLTTFAASLTSDSIADAVKLNPKVGDTIDIKSFYGGNSKDLGGGLFDVVDNQVSLFMVSF